MSSTSIDDLLTFEEERPRPDGPDGGGRLRWVLRNLAGITAAVVVLVAGLRVVGLQISLLVLVAGVVALFAVRRVVTALTRPGPHGPPPARASTAIRLTEGDGTWNWAAMDALRAAINSWETPLDWSATRPERFNKVILPRLGELADERLRLRHGVTRGSDPARARTLLGDRLSTFLERPPRRPPSPRELAAIVAELERL